MTHLYHLITRLLIPVLPLYLRLRVMEGKEDPARLGERKGIAAMPRPGGKLFWLHAASVGETISAMTLAKGLLQTAGGNGKATVLLTSGTLTSAETYTRRIGEFAVAGKMLHQFAPLDCPPWVRRFLEHWRPDLMVLVEGDIWPNALAQARARAIPVALASAQLSKKSQSFWQKGLGRFMAKRVFGAFDMILTTDETGAKRFAALPVRGDCVIEAAGSMKLDSPQLSGDKKRITAIEAGANGRIVVALLSSHDGEEALFLDALGRLEAGRYFAVIAPRHPARGGAIANLASADDNALTIRLASAGGNPDRHDDLLVADTMGEMGSLIRAADIIVLGGGFADLGGHNPMEMALLGKGVISGRHVSKNRAAFDLLEKHHGVIFASNADEVADHIARLASSPRAIAELDHAAQSAAKSVRGGAMRAAKKLLTLVKAETGT